MGQLRHIWWAQRRMSWHRLVAISQQSKLKVAFVSISATLLWVGFFFAAILVLRLIEILGNTASGQGAGMVQLLMGRLLAAMAMALSLMLVISNLLISFSSLYRAKDLGFYLQRPVSLRVFFLARFAENVWMSSWATAYLASPLVLAYGWSSRTPLLFYLAALVFYGAFVTLPAALGALLVILAAPLARYFRWLAWPAFAVFAVAIFRLFRRGLTVPDLTSGTNLQAAVEKVGFSQSPLLPSHWLSVGIQQAASGDFAAAGLRLLLLLTTAAVLLGLATVAMQLCYDRGRAAIEEAVDGRKRRSGGLLDKLTVPLQVLPQPWRALVVKDIKQFWRDPAQWSQFVIFFGLLAFYLASSGQALADPLWRSWRAVLNSTAGLLILATLTTRFIFPLVSLEGRRFWILGLSPVTRRQLVLQKMGTSVGLTGIFTLGLAALSAHRLDLEAPALVLTLGCSAVGTLALSGLAVGLGSLYVNLDEDSPARIVSGLGGTLTFLLSVAYIALLCAGLGLLLHWPRLSAPSELGPGWIPWLVGVAMLALSGLACGLPLWLGSRHLAQLEF